MKRLLLCLLILTAGLSNALAQNAPPPAPTLTPPTPVPVVESGESEVIVTTSAVARIQQTGRVRVGVLYNERPFGELNIRNERVGFDADLARALAEAWDVEVRFRQVTRQTAREMLRDGEVDLLIAAQVRYRDLDSAFEFSQTYHLGSQAMLVRNDDGAASPRDLANRRVGVVIGSPAEDAVTEWAARAGLTWTVTTYPTLDRLYGALVNNAVDGIVASRHHLAALTVQNPTATKLLEDGLRDEPYAIAMRRGDLPMRNLVNRTLQYLQASGKLAQLGEQHFLQDAYTDLAVWAGLGSDAPKPGDMDAQIVYPRAFVVPRLQSERVLRVAGNTALDQPDLTESQRRLVIFHRQLIDSLASRWGVTVAYVQASPEEAVHLVAEGQADLAIGVEPNWAWADRVDFTSPYLMRGLRLMVQPRSNIGGFENLIGGLWVALLRDEPASKDQAFEEARKVNVLIRTFETDEPDLYGVIIEQDNAKVAFADVSRLIPYLERYPDDFRLTDRWYSRTFMALAVPRNDTDFRLLVEYTLQEMARDGALPVLLRPVTLPDQIPPMAVWPGRGNTFGFNITR